MMFKETMRKITTMMATMKTAMEVTIKETMKLTVTTMKETTGTAMRETVTAYFMLIWLLEVRQIFFRT